VTSEVKENNQSTIEYLRSILNGKNKELAFNELLNIGLVDASSVERVLPPKDGGVGLARKIGMIARIASSIFMTNGFLCYSSADFSLHAQPPKL